jgi:hypothetical protein
MSWLKALNFFVLQWFFFRLARMIDEEGRTIRYLILGPVLPLTGWWSCYIWLKRRP